MEIFNKDKLQEEKTQVDLLCICCRLDHSHCVKQALRSIYTASKLHHQLAVLPPLELLYTELSGAGVFFTCHLTISQPTLSHY